MGYAGHIPKYSTREKIGPYTLSVMWNDNAERYDFYINANFYDFHYNEVEVRLFVEHTRKMLRELTLQELERNNPKAFYVGHVGGNYGSFKFECSGCGETALIEEYNDVPVIDQIKHDPSCSYRQR